MRSTYKSVLKVLGIVLWIFVLLIGLVYILVYFEIIDNPTELFSNDPCDNVGSLSAINLPNGDVLWKEVFEDNLNEISIENNTIQIVEGYGNLYRADIDDLSNKPKFNKVDTTKDYTNHSWLNDDFYYATSNGIVVTDADRHGIKATKSGQEIWNLFIDDSLLYFSSGIERNGTLYFGTSSPSKTFLAVKVSDGSIVWKYPKNDEDMIYTGFKTGPSFYTEQYILAPTADQIFILDMYNGETVRKIVTPSYISHPILVFDDIAIVGGTYSYRCANSKIVYY